MSNFLDYLKENYKTVYQYNIIPDGFVVHKHCDNKKHYLILNGVCNCPSSVACKHLKLGANDVNTSDFHKSKAEIEIKKIKREFPCEFTEKWDLGGLPVKINLLYAPVQVDEGWWRCSVQSERFPQLTIVFVNRSENEKLRLKNSIQQKRVMDKGENSKTSGNSA